MVRVFSALLPLTVLFFGLGQNGEHASAAVAAAASRGGARVVQVVERGFARLATEEARTKVSWSPSASSRAASPKNGQGRRKHHRC